MGAEEMGAEDAFQAAVERARPALAFSLRSADIEAGGWRWTSHSPTGSGPEGSSPNELRFGSLVSLPPIHSHFSVMRGLDPRIHLLAKRMDCRVKPGNDMSEQITAAYAQP